MAVRTFAVIDTKQRVVTNLIAMEETTKYVLIPETGFLPVNIGDSYDPENFPIPFVDVADEE